MFFENEAIGLVCLIKENRERITKARIRIAELSQTIAACQTAAQARRDAMNPKIIPLPRQMPATAKTPLPKQPGEI